eukprot:354314-Chlamydomonas_euryale.AAC.21
MAAVAMASLAAAWLGAIAASSHTPSSNSRVRQSVQRTIEGRRTFVATAAISAVADVGAVFVAAATVCVDRRDFDCQAARPSEAAEVAGRWVAPTRS